MIMVNENTCKIVGTSEEIITDVAMILRIWYQNIKEIEDKETALKTLKKIGELTVMSEEEWSKAGMENEN